MKIDACIDSVSAFTQHLLRCNGQTFPDRCLPGEREASIGAFTIDVPNTADNRNEFRVGRRLVLEITLDKRD